MMMMMMMMVALDLRIDAVMKTRAFFTTDDGNHCVRLMSDGRNKSLIPNNDLSVFIGPIKLLRSLLIYNRLAWTYPNMLIPCNIPFSVPCISVIHPQPLNLVFPSIQDTLKLA